MKHGFLEAFHQTFQLAALLAFAARDYWRFHHARQSVLRANRKPFLCSQQPMSVSLSFLWDVGYSAIGSDRFTGCVAAVRLRKQKKTREGSEMRRGTIGAIAVRFFAALTGAAPYRSNRQLSGSSDQGGCSGRSRRRYRYACAHSDKSYARRSGTNFGRREPGRSRWNSGVRKRQARVPGWLHAALCQRRYPWPVAGVENGCPTMR